MHILVTAGVGQHDEADVLGETSCQEGGPLFWAASRGMTAVSKKLIELGAVMSVRSGTGCTPLHAAADSGHPKVIRLLLRAGADVRVRNINGSTPAHLAAFRGHTECLRILLHAGSDVLSRDNAGKTVYIYAMLTGAADMWELVKEMKSNSSDSQCHKDTSKTDESNSRNSVRQLLCHSGQPHGQIQTETSAIYTQPYPVEYSRGISSTYDRQPLMADPAIDYIGPIGMNHPQTVDISYHESVAYMESPLIRIERSSIIDNTRGEQLPAQGINDSLWFPMEGPTRTTR